MCSWVSRLGMCSCGPKEFFLDSKGNVQDFFDRVLAVFGSYPDGVWDFSLLRLPLVFCCSRLSGLCFAVRGFRKRCSKARFREAQKIVFVDSKGNVKEFFGSGFSRFRLMSRWCLGLFATRAPRPERVLLFEAFGLVFFCSRLISRQFCSVFCCSRLSGLCFAVRGFRRRCSKARFREAQKIVFVDSKGNVKQFFGSGFGRFRLVSRWCLGLFASRAPRPERVLLFEAFGLVFCVRGWFRDSFAACFAVRGFRACVLVFEAFGGGGPRPDFARPKRLFLWIPKVTWNSFLARVLAVFGSCPDGVWDFSHLSVKARFREAQKIVFVDSKGNVKQFFGSGFGRFRVVS